MLTENLLRGMWPLGNSKVPGLIEAMAANAPAVFAKHRLTSDLVIAHAMAQFTHECGGGKDMVESIEYTPQRACEVWPSRFSGPQDCLQKVGSFAGDPNFKIKLINNVYGGRNGNDQPNDGSKYIGRGLAQVTGKGNYKKLGDKVGLNLVADPNLAIAAPHAFECGVAEFVLNGCLPAAEQDDLLAVSSLLNVGHRVNDPTKVVGFDKRQEALRLWKLALGVTRAALHSAAWVQVSLNTLGATPALIPDGDFGQKSRVVLKAFQQAHGLTPDGQITPQTLAALDAALAAMPVA
jgi:putative chitinase